MPIEDARELAALWGPDPVHPAAGAYQVIVDGIVQDLSSSESRYTNPPKTQARPPGHSRIDLSLDRDAWVRGCTAALPRRDSSTTRGGANDLGSSNRSRARPHRGNHFSRGNCGASHGSYGGNTKTGRGFKQPGGQYKWRRGGRPY
jgi:hypothetical protein